MSQCPLEKSNEVRLHRAECLVGFKASKNPTEERILEETKGLIKLRRVHLW